MKFAKALVFLSMIVTVNAHADLPAGVTNCAAAKDLVMEPSRESSLKQVDIGMNKNTAKPAAPKETPKNSATGV